MRTAIQTAILVAALVGPGVLFGAEIIPSEGGHEGHDAKMHFEHHCAACHGANGISVANTIPNLAGQKAEYVALQLRDFRDKVRPGTMMPDIAADMDNQQIEKLAEYVASLGCGL